MYPLVTITVAPERSRAKSRVLQLVAAAGLGMDSESGQTANTYKDTAGLIKSKGSADAAQRVLTVRLAT